MNAPMKKRLASACKMGPEYAESVKRYLASIGTRGSKKMLQVLCNTTPPFQHQFLVFGEVATLTRHTSGIVELQLSRWSEPSEVELTDMREAFGLCALVQFPHLALVDVLPSSC